MYEERFYRGVSRPRDLTCYEVKLKETDLFCCTEGDLRSLIEDRVFFYRNQLEEYITRRPAFRDALMPVEEDPFAPAMVKEMIEASGRLSIGPMATVAGAIAEFVGRDIGGQSGEYIIENGGDIAIKTSRERIVQIYAKDSPYSGRIGLKIKGSGQSCGVCTSSATVGPSLSLGKADAVSIVARSALFADGLATYVGNSVKRKDDIGRAIDRGRTFPDVFAILVILGDHLGAWGDIEIVKV